MTSDIWKENNFAGLDHLDLMSYLEKISAGHPDPLSVYLPFIEDPKTNILELVLHRFLLYDDYRNDFRYIKLWIMFADTKKNPEKIYNFLIDRGTGKMCSLLYVALADVYESFDWYELAELVYLKGIISGSCPFDKMSKCYDSFVHRKNGKRSRNQVISIEEVRAIPYLKKLAMERWTTPVQSSHGTPIPQKNYDRINLSAIQNTPDIENLYRSPHEKIQPQTPSLVNGRKPLSSLKIS
jgi:Mad3/BUB1 homology region 1